MINKRKAEFSSLDKIAIETQEFTFHVPAGSKRTKLFYQNNVKKTEQTI